MILGFSLDGVAKCRSQRTQSVSTLRAGRAWEWSECWTDQIGLPCRLQDTLAVVEACPKVRRLAALNRITIGGDCLLLFHAGSGRGVERGCELRSALQVLI